MPPFRVTEQEAVTTEYSYDIEAANADEAQDQFEAMHGREKESMCVHEEVVLSNTEITGVEVMDT